MLLAMLLFACTGPADGEPVPTEPFDPGDPLRFDGPAPTNVLMISIDTTRKDHLDPWGELGLTPFLGKMAREGVRLEDHVQCSNWTWHSTSCTLAGRYEVDVGHVPALVGIRKPLPDGIRTIATVLGENGYGSVLQSKNGWLGPKWNNAQGYDVVNPPTDPGGYSLIMSAMAARTDAMQAAGADRWFVHAHLLEPHAPYNPPPEYTVGLDELPPLPEGVNLDVQDDHYKAIGMLDDLSAEEADIVLQHMRLRYQGEIRWMDAQIEGAITELEAQGALDDTLVVLWTDHGEAFLEHGQQTHAHHLYAEENDAVAMFWGNGLRPGVFEGPTHGVDILPTIVDALGLPLDEDLPGYPLGTAPNDRIRYTSTLARQGLEIAAIQGDHKLFYRNIDEEWRLFDRVSDPNETKDLLVTDPTHPVRLELEPLVLERLERLETIINAPLGND